MITGTRMIEALLAHIATMFGWDFMQNAFASATSVALVCGLSGYFLVLRGQSFAGHALAHIGFTGAVGAALIGIEPLWGLLAVALAGGVGIGALGERLAQRDVAIGLVLSVALGFGALLLHFATGFQSQVRGLLFGNLLSVDPETVWLLAALALACLALLSAISRPLLFASLQPEMAEARGVNLRAIGIGFMVIVALVTAQCAQIVGVLMVFALMVGPAAAAQRFAVGVLRGLAVSALLALAQSWLGLVLAYETGWPASFWIAALSAAAYGAAVWLTRRP